MFTKDPYKFAESLLMQAMSGKLECTKNEFKDHLSQSYSDPEGNQKLPPIFPLPRDMQRQNKVTKDGVLLLAKEENLKTLWQFT